MRIPRVSQFIDVVLKHAGGRPETGKQVVVALSLAFASGVKTVIPLPRNRLTILQLY